MGTAGEGPERTLLRAAYLLQRELMAALDLGAGSPAQGVSTQGVSAPAQGAGQLHQLHQLHRLRVFQATLTSWLEGQESAWLTEVRGDDEELHRAELAQLQARAAEGAELAELAGRVAAREGRLCQALRAADRLTFSRREVDLHGAAMLTGLGRAALRAAIERGELQARDDGRGPLITLDVLAHFAEARGLRWDDGLEDPQAGEAHELRLRTLRRGA